MIKEVMDNAMRQELELLEWNHAIEAQRRAQIIKKRNRLRWRLKMKKMLSILTGKCGAGKDLAM
jgi:hypothetical protein